MASKAKTKKRVKDKNTSLIRELFSIQDVFFAVLSMGVALSIGMWSYGLDYPHNIGSEYYFVIVPGFFTIILGIIVFEWVKRSHEFHKRTLTQKGKLSVSYQDATYLHPFMAVIIFLDFVVSVILIILRRNNDIRIHWMIVFSPLVIACLAASVSFAVKYSKTKKKYKFKFM